MSDTGKWSRHGDATRLAPFEIVDDVRLALGEVYSGAETLDAEELIDQLERRGLRVVRA